MRHRCGLPRITQDEFNGFLNAIVVLALSKVVGHHAVQCPGRGAGTAIGRASAVVSGEARGFTVQRERPHTACDRLKVRRVCLTSWRMTVSR